MKGELKGSKGSKEGQGGTGGDRGGQGGTEREKEREGRRGLNCTMRIKKKANGIHSRYYLYLSL